MRWISTAILVLVVGALYGSATQPAAPAGPPTPEEIDRAVEAAKQYLWSRRRPDRHWEPRTQPAGAPAGARTAVCFGALAAAGEFRRGPNMKEALKWLAELEPGDVRTRARRTEALRWPAMRRDEARAAARKDVAWLLRKADRCSPHGGGSRDGGAAREDAGDRKVWDDLTTVRVAVAVRSAAEEGVEVPAAYWRRLRQYLRRRQNADGSWCLRQGGPGDLEMTALAAVAMLPVWSEPESQRLVGVRANVEYPCVDSAVAWIGRQAGRTFGPAAREMTPALCRALHAVCRLAMAGGIGRFGSWDWYRRGGRLLVDSQKDGAWGDDIEATALGLLFLVEPQPVLMNKLRYDGQWNCQPRDLANFSRWVKAGFGYCLPLWGWQTVSVDLPAREWHDAPILYISGAAAPRFTDEQLARLRRFVQQGGMIFSEAVDSNSDFDRGMRACYRKMFPGRAQVVLAVDHPIYRFHYKIKRHPALLGVSNGVRPLAVHSPGGLSRAWQFNHRIMEMDSFHLGLNMYFYATGRNRPRRRAYTFWPAAKAFEPAAEVTVVRVRHAGNWDPEPLALRRFALLMGNRHRVKVHVAEPVAAGKLDAKTHPVAVMTGVGKVEFSDAEAAALKRYVSTAGTLVIDSAGGGEAFAESAEALAGRIAQGPLRRLPAGHAIYAKAGPKIEKVRYTLAALAKLDATYGPPRLLGAPRGGRVAIVLSKEDLTAGLLGCRHHCICGYQPDSAFAIMRNVVLYASGKTLKP